MQKPAFKKVILFLILVFAASWGLYAFDRLPFGVSISQGELLPLGMLMPAFIALLFDLFSDPGGNLHFRRIEAGPCAVIYGFLFLTFAIAGLNLLGRAGVIRCDLVAPIGSVVSVLWTLSLINQVRRSEPDSFRKAGLQIGEPHKGVPVAAGVVIFFLLQAGLNLALGLGKWLGVQESIAGIPIPSVVYPVALIVYLGIVIVGTPLGNLAILFGEEYAWRGFLLRELAPLGRRGSALIIGLVWGVWHIPILRTGIHTYPPTGPGFLLAIIFFTLWSFVQSYVVHKAGSVWAAAFLHGIVNGVYALMLTYMVYPRDKLFSFGLGIYGLVMLAIIVAIILRDPIWSQQKGENEQ